MSTERKYLEEQAKELGVEFRPNISDKKLQERVDEKLLETTISEHTISEEDKTEEYTGPTPEQISNARNGMNTLPESMANRRQRLYNDAARQVRIRVTCMNPNKSSYAGEFITAGNSIVGTFKKYVQYNAENGYHVPYIIYQYLKEKEYQMFYTVTDKHGNDSRKGKLVKEFAIEVMAPLTEEERKELGAAQAASGTIGKD